MKFLKVNLLLVISYVCFGHGHAGFGWLVIHDYTGHGGLPATTPSRTNGSNIQASKTR